MAQLSVTKARIDLPTWWGNRQDLARLIALVQTLHGSASADLQSEAKASRLKAREDAEERVESLARAIASNISKNGGDPGRFADPKTLREEVRIMGMLEETNYKIIQASEKLKLEMAVSLKIWNERRTGEPEILLADLDEQEVKSIELSFGNSYSGGASLSLELGKDGAQAALSGPVDWVSSATGQLAVELKRQSSWLGHMSHPLGQAAVSAIFSALILWIVAPNVNPSGWVALMVAFVCFGFLMSAFLTKLVPRFELLRDGKPKVKGKIRWAAGILGTVIVGLGVNGLSKLIGL